VESDAVNKDFTPLVWGGVCAASFVALLAAILIYQGKLVCDENDAFCKRTKFAISLGTISAGRGRPGCQRLHTLSPPACGEARRHFEPPSQ
jgi:hypothetical protein